MYEAQTSCKHISIVRISRQPLGANSRETQVSIPHRPPSPRPHADNPFLGLQHVTDQNFEDFLVCHVLRQCNAYAIPMLSPVSHQSTPFAINAMLWGASVLDPNKVNFSIGGSLFFCRSFLLRGIRFHGLMIPDCPPGHHATLTQFGCHRYPLVAS